MTTNPNAPVAFTRDQLDWLPWVEPLAEKELTPRHIEALVDAARAKSPYFRLLARDPDALEHRTRTDKDIFYNTDAGAPRAPGRPAGCRARHVEQAGGARRQRGPPPSRTLLGG